MKKFRNIALGLLISTVIIIGGCCVFYKYQLSPVNHSEEVIEIEIPSNSTARKIASLLKQNHLIRDERMFLIYVKLMKINDMKAGFYDLSSNMSVEEIVSILQEGSKKNPNQIKITFKEGINIRNFATIVSENTVNTYDSVLELLKDTEYLDELIEKYWFLTEDIKNDQLYYSLEGYLFPDTYYFANQNVSVKEIITKMLNQMNEVLSNYQKEIENSELNIHQLLTLASVIEKEGKKNDFKDISSVFYNRMKKGMNLESCATAYYGVGLEFSELGIATNEVITPVNDYNTYKKNGLPVGPISLPSKNAIEAALNPTDTNNLYFLSDNQGVTYFFETYSEHQKKQQELIKAGKWYR